MLAELKPYPEYKDSSTLRLWDALPTHWTVKRLRHVAELLVSNVDKHTHEGEVPVLLCNYVDVYKNRRITDRLVFMRASATPDEVHRFRIRLGDVLITKDSEAWNDIGVPALVEYEAPDLLCGYHLAILRPRGDRLVGGYLLYALLAHTIAAQFHIEANGVTRYGLSHGAIKDILLPLPPPAEQVGIVRFLQAVDRKLNRFIRAKRRLIEVLTEQKQVIITRAVTKGLNPDVKLKATGIDWLGDVPEHWEVSRIKNEMHCLNTRRIPLSSTERGKMTLRLYDYYGASGVIDKVDEYLFDDNLLLIAEDGANLVLRNLPLAIIARGKFWVNNHAHILKPKRGCLEYFAAVLESIKYAPWITGAAQPKLTQDRLMAIRIPAPPVAEQHEIMAAVSENTHGLTQVLDRTSREINLIREYRTRLIADVVTGKLDVRGFVPSEPVPADGSADEPIEEVGLEDEEAELVEEAVDAAD